MSTDLFVTFRILSPPSDNLPISAEPTSSGHNFLCFLVFWETSILSQGFSHFQAFLGRLAFVSGFARMASSLYKDDVSSVSGSIRVYTTFGLSFLKTNSTGQCPFHLGSFFRISFSRITDPSSFGFSKDDCICMLVFLKMTSTPSLAPLQIFSLNLLAIIQHNFLALVQIFFLNLLGII